MNKRFIGTIVFDVEARLTFGRAICRDFLPNQHPRSLKPAVPSLQSKRSCPPRLNGQKRQKQ